MDKLILHCDCNSFFASVETVAHPEYNKVPMAVCGSEKDRHGIVLAKNELAKKAKIQTGEVIWKAKQKCPELVVVDANHSLYTKYSQAVNQIYYEYTDMIEPFGIDESWLDVTGSTKLFGNGRQIADSIRNRIKKQLGITVSVGVSFNKIFAKLGSDYKKPDATTVIARSNYKEMLYPLPVYTLLYIGRHTAEKLHILGIDTIGQLANADEDFLRANFGKIGSSMKIAANGEYDAPVALYNEKAAEKSIGNGFTFKRDIETLDDAQNALTLICDEVGRRMRMACVRGKTVTVCMRDTNLSVTSKRVTLEQPTCTSSCLSAAAFAIMKSFWKESKPLRSLTVIASGLSRESASQLKLYYTDYEKWEMKNEALERTVDGIKSKFGDNSIVRGVEVESYCSTLYSPHKNQEKQNISVALQGNM